VKKAQINEIHKNKKSPPAFFKYLQNLQYRFDYEFIPVNGKAVEAQLNFSL